MDKVPWIGLVNVLPLPGNNQLSVDKGAYINILAPALNYTDYCASVTEELLRLKYYIVEYEDVEKFIDRANRCLLSDELHKLAENVEQSGDIVLGTLHTYKKD